ncbi:MAG TPA: YqiA/YcfP family alpha/beta fold hydrolase [Bryobacteraceae bacterium]|nr:YqiA/YcfP family alpha/beta fold hydrolase [Bryobacteraceae bacterium]
MNRIIYLHGFASSPTSNKARFFRDRFSERGIDIVVPDLAEGDFEHLTITGQLRVIEQAAAGEPVSLIGSSMGGYLAALYAARHPETERLVLMAPAFNFASRWREHLGAEAVDRWRETRKLPIDHYGDGLIHQLDYGLLEDADHYEANPDFGQPAVIFHGKHDDVVPPEYSVAFAQRHPHVQLHLLDSGHELLNVLDFMWAHAGWNR